jgi:hypothetical protein
MAKERFLAGIDTPILLAGAGIETFLCPEAHHRAARLLPDCSLVEFPESKHEPFLERDAIRDRWFAAIDQFVAASLRGPEGAGDPDAGVGGDNEKIGFDFCLCVGAPHSSRTSARRLLQPLCFW